MGQKYDQLKQEIKDAWERHYKHLNEIRMRNGVSEERSRSAVIRLDPQKPHYFLVSCPVYPENEKGKTPQEIFDQTRYWFESHTCMTNWLGDVDEVCFNGEQDPHGTATLVALFDAPVDKVGPHENRAGDGSRDTAFRRVCRDHEANVLDISAEPSMSLLPMEDK